MRMISATLKKECACLCVWCSQLVGRGDFEIPLASIQYVQRGERKKKKASSASQPASGISTHLISFSGGIGLYH